MYTFSQIYCILFEKRIILEYGDVEFSTRKQESIRIDEDDDFSNETEYLLKKDGKEGEILIIMFVHLKICIMCPLFHSCLLTSSFFLLFSVDYKVLIYTSVSLSKYMSALTA